MTAIIPTTTQLLTTSNKYCSLNSKNVSDSVCEIVYSSMKVLVSAQSFNSHIINSTYLCALPNLFTGLNFFHLRK